MRVHISLNISSLERSLPFYSALFGQEASKTREAYANFRPEQPPIHLALMESGKETGGGVSHLGIELPSAEALQDWKQRLEASGVAFDIEDKALCCYAQADKLWISDPDGYRWEVWVRTGEYEGMGETRTTSARKHKDSTCCAAA
jgi:catechol 2,3-dioxygenase-like lactoylglutathione lyase family enzyme